MIHNCVLWSLDFEVRGKQSADWRVAGCPILESLFDSRVGDHEPRSGRQQGDALSPTVDERGDYFAILA